ncbi:hypothetical protein ADK67_15005 [Saccharothrix sp. NRRL B-16348]|nr:hypothetical protein ADK67_15005 [Saccharothrix sp. NRRL B-16348]
MLDRTFTAVQEDPTPREYDLFLCHAWPDRRGAAAELDAALREQGLEVWFSEREVRLGESLARQLDTGLKTSHVGLVLVTPAFLQATGGWAEREMYALLSGERVIPVLHGVTFEELKARSRLLADVVGLSTSEDLGFAEIAEAIADEVLPAEAA